MIALSSFQSPSVEIGIHSDLSGVDKKKLDLASKRASYLVLVYNIQEKLPEICDNLNQIYDENDSQIISLGVQTRKKRHLALKIEKNSFQIVSRVKGDCNILLSDDSWSDIK
ncbi:hypothetical protein [Methanococcus maripaludis]|uniref:Uncharacterized protein n=1 Tax=Methanococcus maripaludis OS7 TaxID=637915 RepID=A0A2Z5PL26_METMI|nr:hypothetical protein [Methanococcus maripaludis]BAP62126.1 hypothetical protein MMOS7_00400 [Methanococcus maripaludis OS7]